MLNFIDFEVFKYDWLCVIINPIENIKTICVNDTDKLRKYYEEHKEQIFIGQNIRGYDQYIFKGLLLGMNPKYINDKIINNDTPGYKISDAFNKINLNIYDVKPNRQTSLKAMECFMGESIEETDVPFDIDRKLTKEEIASTIKYCTCDVENTLKVFNINIADFKSQIELIKTFKLPFKSVSKTKPQLTAQILKATPKNYSDEWNYTIPSTAKIKKYKSVIEWFKNPKNKDYDKFLEIDIAGVPHTFAWGGLHGAIKKYNGCGYFVNVDVGSYYPSLMIAYGYISRSVQNPKLYEEIYHTRLKYKKLKDPRQAPYKIVLNSTYGAMKDKFNALYDPLMANNVCVGGQILLLDLLERFEENNIKIIQTNTDGVLVKLNACNDEEAETQRIKLKRICSDWEQRSKMNLEFDEFIKVIQADVNNYVIVDKSGHYKSKGACVKKLSTLDYDLPIINRALINKLVNNVSIEETIKKCDDLKEFQKLVKVTSKYHHALYNNKIYNNKFFRVFASKEPKGCIYKCKLGKNPEKVANTPTNCFIYNKAVNGVKIPSELDKAWYIEEAEKRLERFLNDDLDDLNDDLDDLIL